MDEQLSVGAGGTVHGEFAVKVRFALTMLVFTFAACLIFGLLNCTEASAKEKKRKNKDTETQGPVFYPDLPAAPRVQFLATYNGEQDVKPKMGRLRRFAVGDEDDTRAVEKPYGVAIKDGKLYICDLGAGHVMVLGLDDQTSRRIGDRAPGKLIKPVNLAIDTDGTCYVADAGLRRVLVFDKEGQYLRAFGDPENLRPVDVAIHENKLYVCDRGGGVVLVLDKVSGEELGRVGSLGSGEAQFYMPTNLALDGEGNLFVTDTGNARILVFDAQGTYLRSYSSRGKAPGLVARPKGIAVDREGRVFVVDASFENIQIFDADGSLLLFFGVPGNEPGGLNLPAKIVVDYDNVDLFKDRVARGHKVEFLLLVTSQFGLNKVNVYGFLKQDESVVEADKEAAEAKESAAKAAAESN